MFWLFINFITFRYNDLFFFSYEEIQRDTKRSRDPREGDILSQKIGRGYPLAPPLLFVRFGFDSRARFFLSAPLAARFYLLTITDAYLKQTTIASPLFESGSNGVARIRVFAGLSSVKNVFLLERRDSIFRASCFCFCRRCFYGTVPDF